MLDVEAADAHVAAMELISTRAFLESEYTELLQKADDVTLASPLGLEQPHAIAHLRNL